MSNISLKSTFAVLNSKTSYGNAECIYRSLIQMNVEMVLEIDTDHNSKMFLK